MSARADFTELAATLDILAPPNVRVAATEDGLRIALLEPRQMVAELVVFAVTPKSDVWKGHVGDIASSFDHFAITATEISQHATSTDHGLGLAQDVYNSGVVLNPHNWSDLFRFDYEHVAMDIGSWLGLE
ncbi:hypothetical protein [Nocardioides sp. URHA0020]|uniref:hypothetical protein n=1 Tax=Nocardioides sp. URHA0020 TaxID=1380392 RepID=UPI000490701E|nr:hypothetical protein [Nocardioides sp. URHA0020]